MLIELGNQAAARREHDADGTTRIVGSYDDGVPRVTTIHVPDFDDGSTHPDAVYKGGRHPCVDGDEDVGDLVTAGPRLGGYTHEPGKLTVDEFNAHRQQALDYGQPTRLPDHEALLAIAAAWPQQSLDRPTWLEVTPNELTPPGVAEDIEAFLHEFYGTDGKRKPLDVEETHWTRGGPPGVFPGPPPLSALFTDDGRVQQANNYGGGQVGGSGTGSAASSTTFTSGSTWTTNQWTGYKLIVANSAGAMVWGNIVSNTNAGSASVATVDRWYTFATPGGSAGTTPASGYYWAILDGGMTSAWFVGLTGTNITPAHGDHTMSGEITTSGGGLIRKIAPYALTSGTSPMGLTLTPVFTANGTDSLPVTVYAIGAFCSMVVGFGGAGGPMKFETGLNASATLTVSGDQLTVTESEAGS